MQAVADSEGKEFKIAALGLVLHYSEKLERKNMIWMNQPRPYLSLDVLLRRFQLITFRLNLERFLILIHIILMLEFGK